MTDSVKPTEDPNFKGGVMSPNSQRTFSELRHAPPAMSAKQKIILDEDKFESSFLRCMVCRERYNMTDRTPRLFPCHHAFCMVCVMTFYRQEAEYRQSMAVTPSSNMTFAVSISCPNCKANFITTEDGLRQLTTDHRIVQLMDFVGHTDKQTVTYCSTHALQPVNFFCEKCAIPICRDCTVLDHKACSQEQLVVDITSAKQKYMPVIEEAKNNFPAEVKTLEERKSECEKALETCTKGDETVSEQITAVFEKLRKALADREQELLEMAKAGQENNYQVVEEKIQKLTSKKDEVSNIVADIDKATSNSSVQELFDVYKQIRTYKTEPGLEKSEVDKKETTASSFHARDEITLLTRISNFGDIKTNVKQSSTYSSTPSPYTSSTSSYSGGSSYLGGSRYGGYSGSSYTSRYTPSTRSYKY